MGVVLLDRQLAEGETNRRLSLHRLTIGMLAARELGAARPVANWFGSLFSSLDSQPASAINARLQRSGFMTPGSVVGGSTTPALDYDYETTTFLDMFKGMDGAAYLDESGFPGLFNFDQDQTVEQPSGWN